MYDVLTGDGVRSQVVTLEAAAQDLTRQMQRAADRDQLTGWAVTTPTGHRISADPRGGVADVTAAIEHMSSLLIRHHLDTARPSR